MTLIGGYTNPRFRDSFNQAVTGVPLDFERVFVQTEAWGSGKWNEAVAAINAGRTPIISTKLSQAWAMVPKGSDNTRLDAAVNGLITQDISPLKGVPCLSFHHEPEGDGPVPDYNAMWKYLEGRYSVKLRSAGWDLCFIIMGGTLRGWTKWTPAQLQQAIAGVDVPRVYADIYEKPGGGEYATKAWLDPDDPGSPFRVYHDWCLAEGKTAGLAEIGVNRANPDNGNQATFLDALAGSKLAGISEFFCYYDRDPGEGGSTSYTRISQTPAALKSFAKLYEGGVVVPPVPVPGDCSELEAEVAELEAANADLVAMNNEALVLIDSLQTKLDQIHQLSA